VVVLREPPVPAVHRLQERFPAGPATGMQQPLVFPPCLLPVGSWGMTSPVRSGTGSFWPTAPPRGSPDGIVVTIQDDGVWIAEADLPRVFEAFFTTRSTVGKALVRRKTVC
jgi:hypothetical protein